jgi:SAM-dependent methyltransferase
MEGSNQPTGPRASVAAPEIYDRLSALADPIRCRLLLLLERNELTVSEICAIVQLPQSTVSRHLKTLADDGWVAAYRDGTSRPYAATLDSRDPATRRLWAVVGEEAGRSPAAHQDLGRLREVLAERRTRSQEFFSSAAGRWAEMRGELFGERFDLLALLGLLDPEWIVGDLGAGTGLLSRSLAPFVGRVIAVDDSAPMLEAAAARLEGFGNVDLRQGLLEELPIEDGELDAALLILVLHHLAEPERALNEAYRTLKPGGRLLLVDMLPHEHESYRREMGHVWLGFGTEEIERRLSVAGFERLRTCALPPDPRAKGPGLFAAGAFKPRP